MTTAANDNGSAMELRCGQWQDVLADVECDALITDPPYSERTHAAYAYARREGRGLDLEKLNRRAIDYTHMTKAHVIDFVASWSPRVRGWMACMCDHQLIPAYQQAYEAVGRYSFAPLACIEPGSRVRISGDGPSQWSVFLMVSRPMTREMQRWGALKGAYVLPYQLTRRGASEGKAIMGGKPLALMQDIIRDYSRPGDLICDPCAGGATTLLAAAIEGRRAIGAEMDPVTYAKAQARIARGYTPVMRFGDEQPKAVQQSLLTAAGEER